MFCKICQTRLAGMCEVCNEESIKAALDDFKRKVIEKIGWTVEDIRQRHIRAESNMGVPEQNVNYPPQLQEAMKFVEELKCSG